MRRLEEPSDATSEILIGAFGLKNIQFFWLVISLELIISNADQSLDIVATDKVCRGDLVQQQLAEVGGISF